MGLQTGGKEAQLVKVTLQWPENTQVLWMMNHDAVACINHISERQLPCIITVEE